MLECIPYYEPGERITVLADGADLIAKRIVRLKAGGAKVNGRVLPAELSAAPTDVLIGACGFDCPAGQTTVAYSIGVGYYVPLTAGGAVAVGDWVTVGAGGKVVVGTQANAIGRAFNQAATDEDVFVRMAVS